MTLFFAEVRATAGTSLDTISIEIPAETIEQALALLMAWKAGLSVNRRLELIEESLGASRRRGSHYITMREASLRLRDGILG